MIIIVQLRVHNLYSHTHALLIDENHISVCYRAAEKRSSYVNWFTLTLTRIIKYALVYTHTHIHTLCIIYIYYDYGISSVMFFTNPPPGI